MADINRFFKATSEEASITCAGYDFLCIYGAHVNGNYISIVNWGVSAELGNADDIFYNRGAIADCLLKSATPLRERDAYDIAEEMATAISSRLKLLETSQKQRLSDLER